MGKTNQQAGLKVSLHGPGRQSKAKKKGLVVVHNPMLQSDPGDDPDEAEAEAEKRTNKRLGDLNKSSKERLMNSSDDKRNEMKKSKQGKLVTEMNSSADEKAAAERRAKWEESKNKSMCTIL